METQVKRKSFNEIVNSNQLVLVELVLVDFSAEWCGPCKMMKPILQEVKSSVGDVVTIVKIDVDKNNQIATQYQVTGVPTLVLFKDGKQVWRQSGVVQPAALRDLIAKNQ
jgi:thioredoxin 1